jgi:aspartate dehydrogenase
MKKIGIIGYGHLGQYLVERILKLSDQFELVFVWNRSPINNDCSLDQKYILKDLENFSN